MCVYLYVLNKYTQHTHILCKQKLILEAINRLTALILWGKDAQNCCEI